MTSTVPRPRFLAAYAVAAAADLVAVAADRSQPHVVAKPLLAPLLVGHLLRAGRRDPVVVALVFAWAGDVALLVHRRAAFLAGMLFFLGTQLCLLRAFLRRARPRWPVRLAGGLLWLGANALLRKRLGSLRVPMLVYSLALTAMAAAAAAQGPRIAAGGLLFLVSDMLIGLKAAGLRAPAHDVLVMATYIAALALIVTGWAARPRPVLPPATRH